MCAADYGKSVFLIFLLEHPAISRISIRGDYEDLTMDCNTVLIQWGFLFLLKKNTKYDKALLVFILTAAIQAAFSGAGSLVRIFLSFRNFVLFLFS